MKAGRFLISALLVVFSVAIASASDRVVDGFVIRGGYEFSQAELKSLALIKRAKKFAKEKLEFKETHNFHIFDQDIRYTFVNYQPKWDIPFSYVDNKFFAVFKKHGKGEASERLWLAQNLGVTKEGYDILIEHTDGVAGGTVISPAMLRASPFRQAYLVFHEDWHDNVCLPTNFEEASGDLVGEAAAMEFLGYSQKMVRERLEAWLKVSRAINRCHYKISELAIRLKNKKISKEEYLSKRQQYVADAGKKQNFYAGLSPVEVSNLHTYTYYYPLVYRLYRVLDCDLVKLANILKEIDKNEDMREPPWSGLDPVDYFLKSREAERKIEAYLDDIIRKEIAKKMKRRNKKAKSSRR